MSDWVALVKFEWNWVPLAMPNGVRDSIRMRRVRRVALAGKKRGHGEEKGPGLFDFTDQRGLPPFPAKCAQINEGPPIAQHAA